MNSAYIAGLVDGEGSIGFARSRTQLFPRVLVTNTNLDILEDLKTKFGGDISMLRSRKSNWRPAYSWRLSNSRCVGFLSKIMPYLRIKHKQAILVFCWDAIRPRHKGSQHQKAMALLEAQAHWLNKRGINTEPEPMAAY